VGAQRVFESTTNIMFENFGAAGIAAYPCGSPRPLLLLQGGAVGVLLLA
jgi:hypothetical protein